MIRLSDYVISFLEKRGIKDIFMLSGGFCLPLVDSVGKSGINHVCSLHEQAAAIGAEAYAQYKNSPGVCLVTAGPGATNTITGVASAWLDSIPMIILSGQVQSKDVRGQRKVRQIGFQEIDIPSIVRPITKYAKTIMKPEEGQRSDGEGLASGNFRKARPSVDRDTTRCSVSDDRPR